MPRHAPIAVLLIVLLAAGASVASRAASQMPPLGGIDEYVADLSARRERLMAALGPESILILWAAPPRVYSGDVNYEYRQDSNFLYLTGLNEPGGILVLVPGGGRRQTYLFAPEGSPLDELWTGHVPTMAELRAQTGIDQVEVQKETESFDGFIETLLSGASAAGTSAEFAAFSRALKEGRARLGVLDRAVMDRRREPEAAGKWALDRQQAHPGLQLFDASELFARLRQIKTPYEQRVLRRSVQISAEAHVEGMKATRPGRWEYEVEAAIEYWFLRSGALSWGYPSIVGSGPNATTLHYLKSTRQMREGDLLLVDAAANFQGLTGDITRTYPVSGRFSPAQRAIYELVLRAQAAGIAAARPGARPSAVNAAIREVFAEGLARLGLIVPGPDAGLSTAAQVALWFPHSAVHGIGIDVHDPLGALDPGAAFVIEPGLYIRPDRLQTIPDTDNRPLIERLTRAVERYRDIGVRIEDSFLMTSAGPDNLSEAAPKEIQELERVVGSGP